MEIPSTFFTNIINTLIGFDGQNGNLSKLFLMLFGTFTTFAFHYAFENLHRLHLMIISLFTFMNTYGRKKMILTVTITDLQREYSVKASDAARAVLYYIDTHVQEIDRISTIKEYFVSSFYTCGDYTSDKKSTQNIIDQESFFSINKDISCKITCDVEDKEKYKSTTIDIILFTPYNINILKAFVEQCQLDYKQDIENKIHKNKYTFVLSSISETNELKYTQLPFTSNKTFDNMFFSQKSLLLSRIDYFLKNRDTYDKVGMPYTLGFLFHGSPGTGKTSAIKAMANYMNRHIIIIPTQLVQDAETLNNIFLSLRINNVDVPFDKRIYVFEEVDCGSWKDIVLDRNFCSSDSIAGENQEKTTNTQICILEKKSSDQSVVIGPKQETKKPSLKLANILEILDGIVETTGRVVIFTSNFPEKIDKALLRPGRINHQIEFTKMEKRHVNDMYKLWFGSSIPRWVYDKMKDHKFSQAELGELFIQYSSKLDELHKVLF